MTELGEAFVPIRATLDKLDDDLAKARGKIQSALGGLGEGLQKAGGLALAGIVGAATAALGGLGVALGFSVGQALEAEQSQADLALAVRNANEAMAEQAAAASETAGALGEIPPEAGFTVESLNELAQRFMNLAGGSDDVITAIETIALRAGSVSSEEMPDFIQRVLDLGRVMGDTSGAAQLLARAQEDPVGAMGRLTRAGVIFSPVLKAQIQDLVKAGDAAGATALLYDRVSEATGGAAAAHAATLAGQWEILKGQLGEAAETVGTSLLPTLHSLNERVLQPLIPVMTMLATQLGFFFQAVAGGDAQGAFETLFEGFDILSNAFPGLSDQIHAVQGAFAEIWTVVTTQVIPAITDLVAQVQPYIEMAVTWLAQNVELQDVLIALGVAIAAFVIPIIVSLVSAVAPIVLAFVGVIAVAALLREAWETDFGGIQEKTAQVWAIVQPLLAQAQEWLQVNLPIAIETLRAWWVDTAWPAIQHAIEVVWPIILFIFEALVAFTQDVIIPGIARLWTFWTTVWWPGIMAALSAAWDFIRPILVNLVDFVLHTVIPGVLDLYTKWTTIWWPTIQTVLQNVWTVIEGVFKELDRWVNANIIPWVEELQRIWAEVVWPAIQKGVEDFWKVVGPIWEDLKLWLDTNIPRAVQALQPIFEGAMSGIQAAVQPLKDLWDAFTGAVTSFWNWITSHTFSFHLSIPDLPDWAVPGSPLPIHSAWKAFAEDLANMDITPRVDLGSLLPVAALVQDGGAERSINFNSTTSITTNQDPMRVLRASRHLDKLGAMV